MLSVPNQQNGIWNENVEWKEWNDVLLSYVCMCSSK